MEYKHINEQKLTRCFNEWCENITRRQPDSSMPISFKDGVPNDEEGYKKCILEKAEVIKKKIDWTDPHLIGSGKLHAMAMELLAIHTDSNRIQNLVDYHDVLTFCDLLLTAKCKDIEKALYLLYAENRDMEAFMLLSHVLKKKYALISYFFFLKDSKKYQVVRPDNAAKRFSLIDAPVNCTLNCTWENYQLFNSVLKEVQSFLGAQMNDEVTLTDAHSFVWMFWMLNSYK